MLLLLLIIITNGEFYKQILNKKIMDDVNKFYIDVISPITFKKLN